MRSTKIAFIIFIIYFVAGMATVKDYGINWDEPAHFMRGQAFLRYLLEGKKDYAGLPEIDGTSYRKDWGYEFRQANGSTIRRSIYQHWERGIMFYTEDILKRGTHPAFSDVIAAFFNYIFFIKLGIAPDIFSYNYYIIFVAALLIAGLYLWVQKYFGSFAALISTLSLGLFPVFWAESHNNIKDIPETVFYSFAVFAFYDAVKTKKIKYVWLFTLWSSVAFATKFNIFFLFATLLLWLVLRFALFRITFRPSWKFMFTPIGMLGLWVLTFPAAWFQPKLLLAAFSYYKTIGTSPVGNDWRYPLYYLFYSTPPVILIFAAVALLYFFIRKKNNDKDLLLLIALWFFIPIIRVMIPGTSIYGGVRQIMEYMPALAILSGIGASKLTRVPKLLIFLSFVPLLATLIKLHPNEGVYFNAFVGGLTGAKEKNIPDWGQTLGNPHRQGITWINEHVENRAALSLGYEYWANLPHIWVRNDISYQAQLKSGPAQLGEYVMSVANPSEFLEWHRMRYLEEFLNPVYQVEVDGVALLKIWKNDPEHIKDKYKNMQEELLGSVSFIRSGPTFTMTLPETRKLLRIELKNENPESCNELNDYVGNIQIYKDSTNIKPKAVRATAYDFNDKIVYPKPFFLFAAEEAKVIVVNVSIIDHPCYTSVRGADVIVIKE